MFTGLIKDIGQIEAISSNAEGKEFIISSKLAQKDIAIDDSVATNGVCLTATAIEANRSVFRVQAVHVTLEKTSLGQLKNKDKVNLELALRPIDRLGGHFVQGHVNGIGRIQEIENRGKNYWLGIEIPSNLMRYCIEEGSIALDGISLTIAAIKTNRVYVTIIPHTWDNTCLQYKKRGDKINIEVDMLAKYLENLIAHQSENKKNLMDLLKET